MDSAALARIVEPHNTLSEKSSGAGLIELALISCGFEAKALRDSENGVRGVQFTPADSHGQSCLCDHSPAHFLVCASPPWPSWAIRRDRSFIILAVNFAVFYVCV